MVFGLVSLSVPITVPLPSHSLAPVMDNLVHLATCPVSELISLLCPLSVGVRTLLSVPSSEAPLSGKQGCIPVWVK